MKYEVYNPKTKETLGVSETIEEAEEYIELLRNFAVKSSKALTSINVKNTYSEAVEDIDSLEIVEIK